MNTVKASLIDDIIKNWFPVVGILFVVAGMSYLFYEGIWQNLNETGRLTIGFISGLALILFSYPLEKSSKIIADSILAGGLLMLYVSLIFGSRFDAAVQRAMIPEVWALFIAALFTVAVGFFSHARRSKYILLIGLAGGYLTPFFIGQVNQFVPFIRDQGVFEYNLPLMAFLIYFLAINVALLWAANRFFLKGIGLLNSLGLFAGTLSLAYLMGGQFPDNAKQLALFSVSVLGLNVAAMCVNARKFEKENDPYLLAGYLLPLVWYAAMVNVLIEPYLMRSAIAGLMFGSAFIYFVGWHYLRMAVYQNQHSALYLGGVLSLVTAVIKLQPYLQHYDGLIFALAAVVFALLYIMRPSLQREMAFFLFAGFGILMTLWHLHGIRLPDLWFVRGQTLALVFALSPFLLGGRFPEREDEGDHLKSFRRLGCYLAIGLVAVLIFLDLVRMEGIPKSLLFLTIPAAIAAYASYVAEITANRLVMIKLSLVLAATGFFSTLLTIVGRFSPFPSEVYPLVTPVSFMGATTLIVIAALKKNLQRLSKFDPDETDSSFGPMWRFFIDFSFYLVLWATVTHEFMAAFNAFDVGGESIQGLRSFVVTLWWLALAAWMILLGVRNPLLENQKNIGFGLLAVTVFKILFIDLRHIDTNLKVFVFLTAGGLMLAISYFANKRQASA